jgi:anti-sigma B factor antagonist
MALTITSHAPYPGLLTLTLVGELDLATAGALRGKVTDAVKSEEIDAILLDLDGLTFIDSTGIGTLVAGWRQAGDSGKPLRIDRAHGMAREVLRITGVWPTLTGDGTTADGAALDGTALDGTALDGTAADGTTGGAAG